MRQGCGERRQQVVDRAHANDREAALKQWLSRLAGRAPDLEQPASRFEPGQLDEVVEQLLGIRRPRGVVDVSGAVEGPPQRLGRPAGTILSHHLGTLTRNSLVIRNVASAPSCSAARL